MAVQYKTKPPSDECKWICIYPLYLNSRKTIAQGRRVAKSKAVDSPTAQEIYDILTNAGMKAKIEKKMHPLDPNRDANAQGRVRMSLMLYACEMIPKLKSRQAGGGATSQTTVTGNSSVTGGTGGGGGKANKKKKR
ncbi:unnamed protein product [Gongylonema pulchrum]|uniref:Signal recognition particle 19 kDa protein n=1 Tax=Gongylonema pulchrum TaxID=637853 RepID=A0A183EI95_9BILA|nr:unnamed protein product [Gongylonema pulchrum]